MDELYIDYEQVPKNKKIINIVTGAYLGAFASYFAISQAIANHFGVLFYVAIIGVVCAIVLVLNNTVWLSDRTLKIDKTAIEDNLSPKSGIVVTEWTDVSQVNIGISYILFLTYGGKKQRKLELSSLVYADLSSVKAKVIELCENKNIPFHND